MLEALHLRNLNSRPVASDLPCISYLIVVKIDLIREQMTSRADLAEPSAPETSGLCPPRSMTRRLAFAIEPTFLSHSFWTAPSSQCAHPLQCRHSIVRQHRRETRVELSPASGMKAGRESRMRIVFRDCQLTTDTWQVGWEEFTWWRMSDWGPEISPLLRNQV